MLLSHAFTCSIYAPSGAEDTSGIPHQTAVPNTPSHKCIYSTSELEMLERSYCVCWLNTCPVSCVLFLWPSSGLGWEDPETWTGPGQSEVLEQLLKSLPWLWQLCLWVISSIQICSGPDTGSPALSCELLVLLPPVVKAMVCSSGLLHPFVKMPFNSLGITK